VAGRFYAGERARLERQLDACMPSPQPDPSIRVCIGPHAGWVYSGAIYGEMLAQLAVPRRVVLVGPNHTGRGPALSLWSGGEWEYPNGSVSIDTDMVDALAATGLFELDRDAHRDEHCLEVQVPFLARRQPELRITPIVVRQLALEDCRRVGETLARVVSTLETPEDPILLAISTDMSHFESATRARELDQLAIDRVEAMDPEGLYRTVRARKISMCGFVPTTLALYYGLARGLGRCRLIRYGHSGEVSGDLDRVVGYAGLVIS
jgi:AmmeMemoRadiSam system protein B